MLGTSFLRSCEDLPVDSNLVPIALLSGRPLVRCRACRRPLRDPESRALRLGPECQVVELRDPPNEVEQETLPGLEPAG